MQKIEIRIKGQIDRNWSDSLAGLMITHTGNGDTLLHGTVRDQAALYGLLFQLSNLSLQLISVSASVDNSPIVKEVQV